jgi:hypothetical protein
MPRSRLTTCSNCRRQACDIMSALRPNSGRALSETGGTTEHDPDRQAGKPLIEFFHHLD